MEVKTNYHRRPVVEAFELTQDERKEFDYLDWQAIDNGEHSASFVRYKNDLIDLSDTDGHASELFGKYWDNYKSDTYFSGLLFKWITEDYEWSIIVARYCT